MLISVVLLYTLRAAAEEWDWFQCVDSANFDAANHQGPTLNDVTAEVFDSVGKKIVDSVLGTTTATEVADHKGSSCYGTSAVLRMSFTLTVFHVLILVLISPRLGCCSAIHDGIWPAKLLFIIGVYIGSFWIP